MLRNYDFEQEKETGYRKGRQKGGKKRETEREEGQTWRDWKMKRSAVR